MGKKPKREQIHVHVFKGGTEIQNVEIDGEKQEWDVKVAVGGKVTPVGRSGKSIGTISKPLSGCRYAQSFPGNFTINDFPVQF